MNRSQRKLKAYVRDNAFVDKVMCCRDGSVELRKYFFYRMGKTAESWGGKVQCWLPEEWKLLRTVEEWRQWPKDSWFVAVVVPSKEGSRES